MTKKQRRYFPNNWRAVNETEAEYFPQIAYEDFYEFHLANWLLPSSHECVIRATNLKTKQVKEYTYRYRGAAYNRIKKLYDTHEFVVCDHEAIQKLTPNPINNENKNRTDQVS